MLREFASRLFHQRLELRAFRSQAALQGPVAQVQFPGDILQSWPLASEKFLENTFHLLREGFVSQLLGQFGLQLRRDQGEELGVVGQEGPLDVRCVKHKDVVARTELYGALEIRFVYSPVSFHTLEFHAFGMDRATGATATNGYNPREAGIDEGCRFGLIGQEPQELNGAFITAFGNFNLLRAG